MRKCWVQVNGVLYEKGTEPGLFSPGEGPMIAPDQPDFVSPIDGKLYSGRTGMREHCKVHDVVSNRDLVGLPTLQSNSDVRSDAEKRRYAQERKRHIIQGVYKHVYGVD